jgi:hypothetical protein
MSTYLTLLLCFLIAGLALLLARENKLRRALQSLCTRLLGRISQLSDATSEKLPGPFGDTFGLQRRKPRARTRSAANTHTPRRPTRSC